MAPHVCRSLKSKSLDLDLMKSFLAYSDLPVLAQHVLISYQTFASFSSGLWWIMVAQAFDVFSQYLTIILKTWYP